MSVVGLSTSSTSSDAESSLTNSCKEADAVQSSSGNDTLVTKDVDLRQKEAEEKYLEQMAELKKAEEDLRLKEELYKHEDEAMLERLTAQNSFIEKLDVQKVQLMYFIEAQQQPVPAALETSLSTGLCHSDGHLNEVADGWQEQMYPQIQRAVFSASGRLLTTSGRKNLEGITPLNGTTCPGTTNFTFQPVGFKAKQHCSGMLTQTGKSDHKAGPELSVPWRSVSDNVRVKSRSTSAPRLSDEASASVLSDETQSVILGRLARSPSPRTSHLSSLSLVSVPESIHEEHEESPLSGRLSVSEVDIRRHQFASCINRNRWSFDEVHLSGQNAAASIRCLTGSNQDVVITDSGLPSSPEAGHLDSSDMNATMKPKEKASKQPDAAKSLGKPRSNILQKIGATLTSLTRRQDTKQTPVLSHQTKVSHQQSDTGVASSSRLKHADKAKVRANANSGKRPAVVQSKSRSKQPLSGVSKGHLGTSKGLSPSDSVEKRNKPASGAQDKSTMPAKVRESFRSFRERLKLTAGKGLRRKSGDIPVEIFLPKSKVVESSEDLHDLCAAEEQRCSAAVDACLDSEVMNWHMSDDVDWRNQWTGVFGFPHVKELEPMKGVDDDSQFSDDSLNGKKNSSYDQAAGLHYGSIVGPAYDGQCFLPFFQESLENGNCDDGSFSEDSLAEDVSGFSADTAVKELGQKPTAVLLPCNTRDTSPASASACVIQNVSNTSDNRLFETSTVGLINQDIVESEEHSAFYTGDEAVYKQCRQTEVLPVSELQIAPVLRDRTALQTGTVTSAHPLNDDNTSVLAAR